MTATMINEEYRKVGINSTKSADAPKPKDMMSTFNSSKKIYGGTAHHHVYQYTVHFSSWSY